jgi:hypothetical protein
MFEKRLGLDHGVAPVASGIRLCSDCDWDEFLFGSSLVRFVVADYASRCCTKLAMARHVSGDPADDGVFDTSLGIRSAGGRPSHRISFQPARYAILALV